MQEENLEWTIATQKERERELIQQNKSLTRKLNSEKEETCRLRLCMNPKDEQYTERLYFRFDVKIINWPFFHT